MKKIFRASIQQSLRALVVAFVVAAGFAQTSHAVTSTQSIAIPAYEYPTLTNLWGDIDAAGGDAIPFVIVNPSSGPGVSENSDYTARINTNAAADIRSIGYVDSNYQTRPIADVIADIDQWDALYPGATGIFIDRVSVDDAAALCYTAYIHNYIKVKNPNHLVIHNFGTYASPDYEPYGDIFVTAEMDYTLYQTWSAPVDGFHNVAANSNRFWHLVHTTSLANYPDALSDSQNNNAGWVYITDDVLFNPYDEAASYFSDEVTDVGALPASSIPNRGVTDLPAGCLDMDTATTTDVDNGSTTATFSIENTSATYNAPSPNELAFTLPTGVTLTSASGTDWTCAGTTCSYDETIPASSSSSTLSASFDVSCDYSGGTITLASTTFPNTTDTSSIAVAAPADCDSDPGTSNGTDDDERLAETGISLPFIGGIGLVLLASGLFLIRKVRTAH